MKNFAARIARRLGLLKTAPEIAAYLEAQKAIASLCEELRHLQGVVTDMQHGSVGTLQAELKHLQGVVTDMQHDYAGLKAGPSASKRDDCDTATEVKMMFPPGHFYSPIANPTDIAARREALFSLKSNSLGIDFREQAQLDLLRQIADYVETIKYPISDPGDGLTYFYENDQFAVLDAEFLFAALLHFKPKTMIEVGSGYSSLITADVNRRVLGGALNFICIEPFPRQFLLDGVNGITKLNVSKVEDLPLDYFDQLESGDILFIDSSHVSKVGSDVNYLFFEVIPRLKSGVIVHVHDIFLPDEYPEKWALEQNRNWNEQYILHAFLQFNYEWRILWAAHLMKTRHMAEVQKVFPRFPQLGGGGSLWMQRV